MPEVFIVAEDHLKLLRKMRFDWNRSDFGAPAVDSKRPYGNGDVYRDIMEILGMKLPDQDDDDFEFTPVQIALLDTLHKQMKTVLEVLCLSVKTGLKEGDRFTRPDPYSRWVHDE
ncbi:MAG: hypothetical protein KGL39_28930 [Patescibacteria group bacterium]|nr:hypothetical protein [Patescibacteria group bacterium]